MHPESLLTPPEVYQQINSQAALPDLFFVFHGPQNSLSFSPRLAPPRQPPRWGTGVLGDVATATRSATKAIPSNIVHRHHDVLAQIANGRKLADPPTLCSWVLLVGFGMLRHHGFWGVSNIKADQRTIDRFSCHPATPHEPYQNLINTPI
jgi:hypothetical protein